MTGKEIFFALLHNYHFQNTITELGTRQWNIEMVWALGWICLKP